MSELLPVRPSLEHLRKEAKALLRADTGADAEGTQLADAQHVVAKKYGFASWPKLKQHVQRITAQAIEAADESRPLPKAANDRDFAAVRAIVERGGCTQHDLDLALARSL